MGGFRRRGRSSNVQTTIRPHKGPTILNPHPPRFLMDTQTKITLGMVFHRLTVVGISLVHEQGTSRTKYRCRCECGNYSTTTAASLRKGQMSCGCARGGARDKPRAVPSGMKKWTPEIAADVLRAHALGLGVVTIARHLCVGQAAVRSYLVECGRLEDVSADPKPDKPKVAWPEGLKFEDMPKDILARESKGRAPKPVPIYSYTGNSAQMCVG